MSNPDPTGSDTGKTDTDIVRDLSQAVASSSRKASAYWRRAHAGLKVVIVCVILQTVVDIVNLITH